MTGRPPKPSHAAHRAHAPRAHGRTHRRESCARARGAVARAAWGWWGGLGAVAPCYPLTGFGKPAKTSIELGVTVWDYS